MTAEMLRKKVEDMIIKSNAMSYFWMASITGEQLQEEMQRMEQNTKNPQMLKELWGTLNNDPHLIAECLARPVLIDKQIRNLYAFDKQIHGILRQQALSELLYYPKTENIKMMNGLSSETTIR